MGNQSSPNCPQCGAVLPGNAPAGLCPNCLMALNLKTETVFTDDSATAQSPLSPAELAPRFPQLEILECLGRGGMGVVYKTRQKSLNRVVALKLLAPERVADAKFAQRFTHEAQALAALNHPSIVTIYDFGQAGGFYFLLMEFVDGVNLRQAMNAGRFTPEQALAVVPPVCEALQYAHEHGIVHRDIKPENLLLDKDGRVKIADFGIAKMLHADGSDAGLADSQPAGTPQYMAPEQKAPGRTDHRADIYSLGVVLYELLTGELPGANLQPPSSRIRGMQIDARLDEIVLRALETKPELRYQTAGEMRTQVETFTSSPRGSRANEAPSEEKVQSLLTPAATGHGPRLIKIGASTFTTPEQLATAAGQFFAYRTRGQLILDDRQITHSCGGTNTVIPLAAISDLSVGKFPRTVNPMGLDLISVTYEEGGQRKQILLSPMQGWFGFPSTVNARVAEWFAAIRESIIAATGRAPGQTPAAQLNVPGSHNLLVPILFTAPVAFGLFIVALARLSPGVINSGLGLLLVLLWGIMVIAVSVIFVRERRAKPASGPARMRGPLLFVLGILALAAVFLPAVLLLYRAAPSSGATHFDCVPVGVSNSVVIVDVTTEADRGNAELRAVLDGPQLPAETEADLAATFFPPFAGTFIKPNPSAGNHPWRILAAGGRQTWRLGFVLPDAALARDAFASLRSIGPLPAVANRTFSGTLFEVSRTNGQQFRASLQVALPFASADPDRVSVFGQSQRDESAVTLTWDVLASQTGLAYFSRAGSPILVLRPDPRTKLYGVSVGLELIKAGTNRVQLVRRIGGDLIREELPGDFRELSGELLRTASFSAKAASGTRIELCQFQGKPFTVQVHVTDSPGSYRRKVGAVALFILAGGITLLVVLVRKSGAAGKTVLWVIGAVLLLFFVSVFIRYYLRVSKEGQEAVQAELAARVLMEKAFAATNGAPSAPQHVTPPPDFL